MRTFADKEPGQLPFFMKRLEAQMSLDGLEKRPICHLAWFSDIGLMHCEAAL
jgi:hypothetical protein